MMDRVRERIRADIRAGKPSAAPLLHFDAMPDWMRMAAAVVFMLGLSVLTHREMLREPVEAPGQVPPEALVQEYPAMPEPVKPPAYLLHNEDPFFTRVEFADSSPSPFVLPSGLDPDLEAALMRNSLQETNRLDRLNTLPVGLRLSP
jgi:hypothetical protein